MELVYTKDTAASEMRARIESAAADVVWGKSTYVGSFNAGSAVRNARMSLKFDAECWMEENYPGIELSVYN